MHIHTHITHSFKRRIFAFCEIEPTFFGRKEDSNSMSITLYASAASFGVAELH